MNDLPDLRYLRNKNQLTVCTKSRNPLGVKFSVFSLKLDGYTLENIFQSSKVFTGGGAYRDLLDVLPKYAKRDTPENFRRAEMF